MKIFFFNKISFKLILILFSAGLVWNFQPLQAQQVQNQKGVDSLFKEISIQDLIKIKKYYDTKVKKLRKQEESYRSEGMEWSKSFLKGKGSQIKNRDRVYIRLAEYYIEEAERKYDAEVDAYDEKYNEYEKQLALFDEHKIDKEPAQPEYPKYDYSEAIALFNRILKEYPSGTYADDALFNKGWLLEKMGKGDAARRVYRDVIYKFPDSRYAPDAYMRLGEYYFSARQENENPDQRIIDLRKAIQLYKNVLKYRDSKRYDEALYKLGWSYYKLAAKDPKYYNETITYFITLVDDILKAQKYDPEGTISNFDVKDEAIEYIGICFTDEAYSKNGVDKARKILERIGGRSYGPQIMKSIGTTFQKVDEDAKAVYAYRTLLDMYPDYKEAPLIQQNIVTALYALGKDQQAYNERKVLYTKYNSQADWYKKLEASDIPDKAKYLKLAYKYSESALRTNLLLDLQKAEDLHANKQPATQAYNQFAAECQQYLKLFPADSNAYDVNWSYALMLDTRLGKFKQAFEEYIKVSNDYLETSHQEDAALNAVGVADTLVKLKYGNRQDTVKFNLADVAKLNPENLSPEETRLIEAYRNYIKLFPNGQYTANFLAAAGGIYYYHKKFAESKIYFQTLVKRFPGAEQKSLAMRSIMDSYFALGKFKDSELYAKRIMNEPGVSGKQKKFAEERLGWSIFKNAEYLEEQGDYFTAATEYQRVYKEAPSDKKIVETALFNSGFNFQRAKDWVRAIGVLDTLVTHYPKSKFAVSALQKIADDYNELEQYTNAAKTYERLYKNYPKADNADVALYNAGYYYKKGKSWADAIRVNNLYIQKYPKQKYSTDLFFANADLYLKMDNISEANKIYKAFAQKYPDDPRTVTSFYERGKYYFDNKQTALAKAELNKAIQRSETLRKKGKDANPFIAGEAVNLLAEILHQEYIAIQLKQPQSNINANLKKAKALMRKLDKTYTKVLSFGSPRSFEAAYNIARSYEEFARMFVKQEIPANLSADKKFVKKKTINDQAARLYDKAVQQYKLVVENMPKIADKLGVDLNALPAPKDTIADTSKTPDELKRIAEADSTREMARKWYTKAKDKISELLYTEASLTSENIYQAINIKMPKLDPVQSLVYRRGVLLKVVAPAIKATIKAHLRNIQNAKELGLSNKYVEESKRQVLLTSNILGTEFENLAYATFDQFKRMAQEVQDLVEKKFGAKNAKGLDYYALDDDANQILDYLNIFSKNVISAYSNSLALAKENNIKNDLLLNTQDRLLRSSVEMADAMQSYADSVKALSVAYKARFDSTQKQNYNFDDASGFFENYYFGLTDNAKDLMDQAYQIQKNYNIHNLWANKLLYRLIKLDPATYSEGIEKEKFEMFSDTSWKYSTTYFPDRWTKPDFNDSTWEHARIVPSSQNQFAYLGVDPQAIWVNNGPPQNDSLMINDSLATDSSAVADSSVHASIGSDSLLNSQQQDTLVFFRKDFELSGKPMSGMIYVTADEDFRIYVNGEYILDDELNDYSVLDTLDLQTIEIYLKTGHNVIAIDVEDKDLTGQGLKFYARFELLPADITAAAEEKAKVRKVVVDPSILRKVNILDKNRISLKK